MLCDQKREKTFDTQSGQRPIEPDKPVAGATNDPTEKILRPFGARSYLGAVSISAETWTGTPTAVDGRGMLARVKLQYGTESFLTTVRRSEAPLG